MSSGYKFPSSFLWGVATASYQIEGAAAEDGRKPSVWDAFCRKKGRVKNRDNGDIACDHYHRYKDDIRLMRELGVKAYRFSIAWPRVVPDGDGAINQRGLDFYSRLVDALLEAGIAPWATCYHWDMPEATYKKHGGWHGRQSAHDFARFAGIAAGALGDRVKHWFTINEFVCYTHLSYGLGLHAPGEKVGKKKLNQLTHHALLGHGLAVDAIRAESRGALVGLAENFRCFVPVLGTPEHIAAARKSFRVENGGMLVPALTGAYNPIWLERQGADAPRIEAGDMRCIGRPLDFLGLNVYTGSFTRSLGGGEYQNIAFPPAYPLYNIFWLRHLPDALYWGLRFAHEELGVRSLYISENGCCGSDELVEAPPTKGSGGRLARPALPDQTPAVLDVDRVQYLRSYLRSAHRAVGAGIPLKGYFLWTLMDNFEWAEGYTKRFGLYHTDFKTQQRKPKLSAQWYAQVARENRVM